MSGPLAVYLPRGPRLCNHGTGDVAGPLIMGKFGCTRILCSLIIVCPTLLIANHVLTHGFTLLF